MPVPAIGILTQLFSWSFEVRNTFGTSADADSVPTYAIYEHEVSSAIVSGSMAKLGALDGVYTEEITLDDSSSLFESLHTYQLRITWVLNSKTYNKTYAFIVVGASSLSEAGGGSFPVSLSDMKLHLKVEQDADDTLITTLISAATSYCQDFQHRAYITQTRIDNYDRFPRWFPVSYPPLISVTSIVYIDTNGDQQTLAADQYRVDNVSEPGRITPAFSVSWPATRDVTNAVILTYSAGYGDAVDVPTRVKAAIKLLVAHWYEHREDVSDISVQQLPTAARSLLWAERTDVF